MSIQQQIPAAKTPSFYPNSYLNKIVGKLIFDDQEGFGFLVANNLVIGLSDFLHNLKNGGGDKQNLAKKLLFTINNNQDSINQFESNSTSINNDDQVIDNQFISKILNSNIIGDFTLIELEQPYPAELKKINISNGEVANSENLLQISYFLIEGEYHISQTEQEYDYKTTQNNIVGLYIEQKVYLFSQELIDCINQKLNAYFTLQLNESVQRESNPKQTQTAATFTLNNSTMQQKGMSESSNIKRNTLQQQQTENGVFSSFQNQLEQTIIHNAHDKVVFSLCRFSETQLLSCAGDEHIKLWDINKQANKGVDSSNQKNKQRKNDNTDNFQHRAVLTIAGGVCRCIIRSQDNSDYIFGCCDFYAFALNTQTLQVVSKYNCKEKIYCIQQIGREYFACGSSKGNIFILKFESPSLCQSNTNSTNCDDLKKPLFTFCKKISCQEEKNSNGHTSFVHAICKLGQDHLATGGGGGLIKLWKWNNQGGDYFINNLEGHAANKNVYFLNLNPAISHTEKKFQLISGSSDKTVRVWDLETFTEIKRITFSNPVYAATVISDIEIAVGDDRLVRIFNLKDWHQRILSGHENRVNALCTVNYNCFSSGDQSGKIIIWKANNGVADQKQLDNNILSSSNKTTPVKVNQQITKMQEQYVNKLIQEFHIKLDQSDEIGTQQQQQLSQQNQQIDKQQLLQDENCKISSQTQKSQNLDTFLENYSINSLNENSTNRNQNLNNNNNSNTKKDTILSKSVHPDIDQECEGLELSEQQQQPIIYEVNSQAEQSLLQEENEQQLQQFLSQSFDAQESNFSITPSSQIALQNKNTPNQCNEIDQTEQQQISMRLQKLGQSQHIQKEEVQASTSDHFNNLLSNSTYTGSTEQEDSQKKGKQSIQQVDVTQIEWYKRMEMIIQNQEIKMQEQQKQLDQLKKELNLNVMSQQSKEQSMQQEIIQLKDQLIQVKNLAIQKEQDCSTLQMQLSETEKQKQLFKAQLDTIQQFQQQQQQQQQNKQNLTPSKVQQYQYLYNDQFSFHDILNREENDIYAQPQNNNKTSLINSIQSSHKNKENQTLNSQEKRSKPNTNLIESVTIEQNYVSFQGDGQSPLQQQNKSLLNDEKKGNQDQDYNDLIINQSNQIENQRTIYESIYIKSSENQEDCQSGIDRKKNKENLAKLIKLNKQQSITQSTCIDNKEQVELQQLQQQQPPLPQQANIFQGQPFTIVQPQQKQQLNLLDRLNELHNKFEKKYKEVEDTFKKNIEGNK